MTAVFVKNGKLHVIPKEYEVYANEAVLSVLDENGVNQADAFFAIGKLKLFPATDLWREEDGDNEPQEATETRPTLFPENARRVDGTVRVTDASNIGEF